MSILKYLKYGIVRRKFRRHVASLAPQKQVVRPRMPAEAITMDEVIPMLLAQCSGIGPAWQEYLDEYEDDERLHYVDICVVNQYFSYQLKRCQTEEFGGLFTVMETIETHGTDDAINLIGVGFTEHVIMVAKELGLTVDDFALWIGPKSKESWLGLQKLWDQIKEQE